MNSAEVFLCDVKGNGELGNCGFSGVFFFHVVHFWHKGLSTCFIEHCGHSIDIDNETDNLPVILSNAVQLMIQSIQLFKLNE